jgi:hypothetical protein
MKDSTEISRTRIKCFPQVNDILLVSRFVTMINYRGSQPGGCVPLGERRRLARGTPVFEQMIHIAVFAIIMAIWNGFFSKISNLCSELHLLTELYFLHME